MSSWFGSIFFVRTFPPTFSIFLKMNFFIADSNFSKTRPSFVPKSIYCPKWHWPCYAIFLVRNLSFFLRFSKTVEHFCSKTFSQVRYEFLAFPRQYSEFLACRTKTNRVLYQKEFWSWPKYRDTILSDYGSRNLATNKLKLNFWKEAPIAKLCSRVIAKMKMSSSRPSRPWRRWISSTNWQTGWKNLKNDVDFLVFLLRPSWDANNSSMVR